MRWTRGSVSNGLGTAGTREEGGGAEGAVAGRREEGGLAAVMVPGGRRSSSLPRAGAL